MAGSPGSRSRCGRDSPGSRSQDRAERLRAWPAPPLEPLRPVERLDPSLVIAHREFLVLDDVVDIAAVLDLRLNRLELLDADRNELDAVARAEQANARLEFREALLGVPDRH